MLASRPARSGCSGSIPEPKTTAAKHDVKDTGAMTAVAFPALPTELVDRTREPGQALGQAARKCSILQCEGRELNPYRSYPTGT